MASSLRGLLEMPPLRPIAAAASETLLIITVYNTFCEWYKSREMVLTEQQQRILAVLNTNLTPWEFVGDEPFIVELFQVIGKLGSMDAFNETNSRITLACAKDIIRRDQGGYHVGAEDALALSRHIVASFNEMLANAKSKG